MTTLNNNNLEQFFSGDCKVVIPITVEFSDEQLATNPLQNIMDKLTELKAEKTDTLTP